ncbi:YhgE/Pip domain-containing protein [Conexibacter sp. JD483]|uniref:YhgE/Pip domain-containing protein n=1 Tax=unclassified Conexibacter TaxID=2627773 RepID=UPI00271937E1|nr:MULTISPECIES: YhgE/Pip domain-containing protein [unclassified Conexibacter]MDO8188989.1 YhgE/Pip domain-containing protein [Conexibacter sp. CPCC 205706]MDO8201799.1 YhgE/Pip domain-containing protein [Conexibacter sp. CPCC 205762]MDR9371512.1 YhgE/Pip domain-containing protein [Conexibacter sp. JD483]
MIAPFRLALAELRRFRGRLPLAGLLFLLIVPTLYGSLYLWSNWDPYGKSGELPVAVVNEDRPVTVDGREVDAGAEFVRQLRAQRELGWRFTDDADAEDGLKSGRYLMIIRVPSDFSSKLSSPAVGSPERARLLIRLDDANGFIVSIIARTVESELQTQVNAAAYATYAEVALGGFEQVRRGLGEGARGAQQLADGAGELRSGARRLSDGLGTLSDGAGRLRTGSAEVSDGAQQLAGVVDTAAGAVTNGLDRLGGVSTVAGDAADAARQIASGTRSAADVSARIEQQVEALAQAVPDVADDPAYRQLQQLAQQAAQQSGQIATDTGEAAGRLQTLAQQAQTAAGQTDQLKAQVQSGRRQVDRLADGAKQVADGAAQLDDGLGTAAAGAERLPPGARKLDSGATRLADALSSAQARVPASDPSDRAEQADVLANPVQLSSSNAHPAHVYGRGLAPFFLSIALWVFGIVAYLMLRPVAGEALAASRLPALTVAAGGWLPAGLLGCAAALILYAVVDVGLGLDPVDVLGTIGLMLLAVLAFTALADLLRMAFGAVGDAAMLVLLVIQLGAAGGIYPIQTAPGALQAIHPFLPMTYLIEGFRVTISGGQDATLLRAVAVIAGMLVVCLALASYTVTRQRMWTIQRLKPDLEL